MHKVTDPGVTDPEVAFVVRGGGGGQGRAARAATRRAPDALPTRKRMRTPAPSGRGRGNVLIVIHRGDRRVRLDNLKGSSSHHGPPESSAGSSRRLGPQAVSGRGGGTTAGAG